MSSLLLASVGMLAAAAALRATPTPTSTPRPKLSGGFGRPRATPVAAAPSEAGQSLADVVRAAQEARSASSTEKSGVTIDNRSLVKNPQQGRVSTSQVSTAKAAPSPTPASVEGSLAGAEASPSGGGEAEWREIARRDKKRVEDAKARVAQLEAASKKLENDFYAWDDGQYRDRVIKPAWDKTRVELEEARKELAEAEKELSDLPERARKAGALPGWIRE